MHLKMKDTDMRAQAKGQRLVKDPLLQPWCSLLFHCLHHYSATFLLFFCVFNNQCNFYSSFKVKQKRIHKDGRGRKRIYKGSKYLLYCCNSRSIILYNPWHSIYRCNFRLNKKLSYDSFFIILIELRF